MDILGSVKRFIMIIVLVIVATTGFIISIEQLVTIPELFVRESVRALVIVASGMLVVVLIRRFSSTMSVRFGPHPATVFSFFMILITILVATFAVLSTFGVSSEPLLLGGGVATVVLGLAASTFLSNILSGALMIISRPFKAGDSVLVDGIPGRIEEITTTFMRIRNDSGSETVIPNNAIMQGLVKLTRLTTNRGVPSLSLPYSLGDRVYTTYIEGEGVVTEITSYHTKISLDSDKEIWIPNNSVLTGTVHIARIVGSKDDSYLTFPLRIDWNPEETIRTIKHTAEKDPEIFKSVPMVLYCSLDGGLTELKVTCTVDPAKKDEAKSILLKAAYLVKGRFSPTET